MHRYTKTDSERCFRYNNFWGKKNHLVYVGDERVRQLYSATRRWLEARQEPATMWEESQRHNTQEMSNLLWESGALNLRVEFLWAPFVDDTMTKALSKWNTGPGPTVLVLGAGTSAILTSNGSEVALDEHRRNLTKLRPDLENIAEFGGSKVLWSLQVRRRKNHPIIPISLATSLLGETEWHRSCPYKLSNSAVQLRVREGFSQQSCGGEFTVQSQSPDTPQNPFVRCGQV